MEIFMIFGLTRLGIEPVSTVSVAVALPTRPLMVYKKKYPSTKSLIT